MLLSLVIGVIFGFVGSVPIAGPTAALVASLALAGRARTGLYVAAGSAAAECIYAFLAVWGLAEVIGPFPSLVLALRLAGCAALVLLGAYLVARRPEPRGDAHRQPSPAGRRSLLLGFTITIANPTLIVSWTAAVGIANSTGLLRLSARDALPFAAGAGVGAVIWFAVLVWLLRHARSRMSARTGERAIRALGVALIVCGAGLGARVLAAR